MMLSDILVQWKVRLAVAGAMASLVVMPYLMAREMQRQLLEWGIRINFLAIMGVGLFCLLLFGYLYDVRGFLNKEQGYIFKRNDEWLSMMKKGEK